MADYVVMGSADNGVPLFYDVDSGSGYPYASPWRGRTTEDVNVAIGWLAECGPNKYATMNAPAVHRVRYEQVDISEHLKTINKLKDIADSLTPAERALLKSRL